MNAASIQWYDTNNFASVTMSRGYYAVGGIRDPEGVFTVRFVRSADGRSIKLRHGKVFVGSFQTVGAAKRKAIQIVKGIVARHAAAATT